MSVFDLSPNQPSVIQIDDETDPRIAPYRNLRERTLRGESIFIAEGHLVTERLLTSPYRTESVLLSLKCPETESILSLVPGNVPVYRMSEKLLMDTVVGFEFHQGILALGRRETLPDFPEGLALSDRKYLSDRRNQVSSNLLSTKRPERGRVWVVLPNATKPDNLGLVFRCAAALNAEAVVLGEECCDPFSRRALRVSMGGVLQIPIYQARDLRNEIRQIKNQEAGSFYPGSIRDSLQYYATVLDETAVGLHQVRNWPTRAAFLFGNEYTGLDADWIALCDQKLMIPMRPGVDSLNLGVSVGVFLYEYQRQMNFPE